MPARLPADPNILGMSGYMRAHHMYRWANAVRTEVVFREPDGIIAVFIHHTDRSTHDRTQPPKDCDDRANKELQNAKFHGGPHFLSSF